MIANGRTAHHYAVRMHVRECSKLQKLWSLAMADKEPLLVLTSASATNENGVPCIGRRALADGSKTVAGAFTLIWLTQLDGRDKTLRLFLSWQFPSIFYLQAS